MGALAATADVRDMVCAQALARVAQALARLSPGETLEVRCNAADVKRDLLAWARERGHDVKEVKEVNEVNEVNEGAGETTETLHIGKNA
jgi:TusA-related sulfurtransferase